MAVFGTYLLTTGSQNWILIGFMYFVAWLAWANQSKENIEITMEEAKEIAKEDIKKMQDIGEVPDGTITLIPEKQMRLFIVPTKEGHDFKPMGYVIMVKIDTGLLPKYYAIDVSKYGTILSETQIHQRRSIKKFVKEIMEIKAEPTRFQQKERRLTKDDNS